MDPIRYYLLHRRAHHVSLRRLAGPPHRARQLESSFELAQRRDADALDADLAIELGVDLQVRAAGQVHGVDDCGGVLFAKLPPPRQHAVLRRGAGHRVRDRGRDLPGQRREVQRNARAVVSIFSSAAGCEVGDLAVRVVVGPPGV